MRVKCVIYSLQTNVKPLEGNLAFFHSTMLEKSTMLARRETRITASHGVLLRWIMMGMSLILLGEIVEKDVLVQVC